MQLVVSQILRELINCLYDGCDSRYPAGDVSKYGQNKKDSAPVLRTVFFRADLLTESIETDSVHNFELC